MALLIIQVVSMIGDTLQHELPICNLARCAEDLSKLERIVAETEVAAYWPTSKMGMLTPKVAC